MDDESTKLPRYEAANRSCTIARANREFGNGAAYPFDNGKEFTEHELLARRLQMSVFFAQPYCPWQRGTCENTNGLIRQFFPKGTSFENISPRRVADVARLLNHRPRKSLGYLTPSEVFHSQKSVAIEP